MESKLFPFAGRHAVQSVVCVLTLRPEFDASTSNDVIDTAHAQIKDVLPEREPIQAFTFQFGPAGVGGGAQMPRVNGWQFAQPVPSAERKPNLPPARRVATLQADKLSVVENEYNRWADFQQLVDRVVQALSAVGARSLVDVALAYNDVFVWRDDRANIDASGIFDPASNVLPLNVFAVGSNYFHSNHGYFSSDIPAGAQSLVENVNAARVPDPISGFDHFVINTEHRLVPQDSIEGADNIHAFVMKTIDGLHRRNKQILGNLLAPHVREMISLGV